jgi:hypothetical protein
MSSILILGAKSADMFENESKEEKSYVDFLKEKTPFLEIVESAFYW